MATRISLSTEDEKKVLHAIRHWKLRNRCLIEFGLRTGFRASEIGSIAVCHIWDGTRVRDEVTVSRCRLKGGRGIRRTAIRSRTIPLSESTKSLLAEYLEERRRLAGSIDPDQPLFLSTQVNRGIGRWMINKLVQRACLLAGLPQNGRFGSHSLRKTFARRIYAVSGHDINLTRAALAHSSILITQRYLEIDEQDLRAAILAASA